MREQIRDKERLEHMLAAINVLTDGKDKYTFEQVVSDPIVYFGFVKYVEVIGEACYKLTTEFRRSHDEVDWEAIEGMRHVLVHGYYQISQEQLWDTVINDIPELKPFIEKYVRQIESNE